MKNKVKNCPYCGSNNLGLFTDRDENGIFEVYDCEDCESSFRVNFLRGNIYANNLCGEGCKRPEPSECKECLCNKERR